MKALTIIQPFAELIIAGEKRVENRTWETGYRGPLAIHAGVGKRYMGHPVGFWCNVYDVDNAALTFGAVIGTVDLVDCIYYEPIRDSALPTEYEWISLHEHTSGPWCWVLANPRRFPQPIPARGKLGLWNWQPPAGGAQ